MRRGSIAIALVGLVSSSTATRAQQVAPPRAPEAVRAPDANEGLADELRQQQEEIARLEAELADRRIERQRLGQLVDRLAALRDQIAAGQNAAAAAQAAAAHERARQQQDLGVALDLLRQADATLLTGDGAVGDQLDEAEGLLPEQYRRYIAKARDALSRSDLSGASLAIEWILGSLG